MAGPPPIIRCTRPTSLLNPRWEPNRMEALSKARPRPERPRPLTTLRFAAPVQEKQPRNPLPLRSKETEATEAILAEKKLSRPLHLGRPVCLF